MQCLHGAQLDFANFEFLLFLDFCLRSPGVGATYLWETLLCEVSFWRMPAKDGEPNVVPSKPQLSDTKFKTQASTNPFENTQNFNFQRTLSTEVPCLSAIPLIQDRNVALAAARDALPPVHVPAEEGSSECSRGV